MNLFNYRYIIFLVTMQKPIRQEKPLHCIIIDMMSA